MDAEVNNITLGESFDKVSPQSLLRASQKLLNINKGTEVQDERDSLIFKNLYAPEDLLHQYFVGHKKLISSKLTNALKNRETVSDVIPSNLFTKPIHQFFTVSDLSSTPPQTNPVSMVVNSRKTTSMGEGGIQNMHSITMETRDVQPSHLGFLDPISTPECFTEGHEVLTDEGWIDFKDLTLTHKVLTLANGTPGSEAWQNPTAIQQYTYNGPVFRLYGRNTEHTVSPSHRVLISTPKNGEILVKKAEELKNFKGVLIPMNVIAGGDVNYNLDYMGLCPTDESYQALLRLLGFYLGESTIFNGELKFNVTHTLEAAKRDKEHYNRLKFIRKLEEPLNTRFDVTTLCISQSINKDLIDYLSLFGTTLETKTFPIPAFKLSRFEAFSIYEGLKESFIKSVVQRDSDMSLVVPSQLASFVMDLGQVTGVMFIRREIQPQYAKDKNMVVLDKMTIMNKFSIEQKFYSGDLYCATVPGTFLYVRKAGKTMGAWSGNSLKTGVAVGLSSEVIKHKGDMKTPVVTKKGDIEYKSPMEIYNSVIGFPDQIKQVSGKPVALNPKSVRAMKKGKPYIAKEEEVDFYLRSTATMFDFGVNLVPFLHSTQGNRASMGNRMATQALALDSPEVPNVQSARDSKRTFENLIGSHFAPKLSDETLDPKIGGVVTNTDKEYVYVKGDNGKDYKIGLYNDFPLNQDGYFNSETLVKPGDKVTATQILAKHNYSNDKGDLAMGKNLTVAYLSYKGNAFEDAATITESAAKKLSHTNIEKINIFHNPKLSSFDLIKFRSTFPEAIHPTNADKLDEEGLPKIGQTFNSGEALAAYLVKKELDSTDMSLKKLNKAMYSPYTKTTILWEDDDPGIVTDVRKVGRNIDIYVKSTHPFKVGDKLSGRFGDKHIVGSIIPDDAAPHRPNGTPVDIMVNPQGVQSRMNMGQMLEAAIGKKVVKEGGIPYIVKNFNKPDGDAARDIADELAAAGIPINERLRDGKSGDYLKNPVFVGNRYYFKLRHLVKKKQGSHSYGVYDINEQPAGKGAQKIGVLDTYVYLGHGSKALLNEATSIKSRKNEEYMRNLQFGLPPVRPASNYAFDKFLTYMQASGVNVEKNGHRLQMMPLTDQKVEELSKGEIEDPGAMLIGKNLLSKKGGLFDPKITGGAKGENYSHLSLPTTIPNPMASVAIKSILRLTDNAYESALNGEMDIDGVKGPKSIVTALSKINVKDELKSAKEELKSAPMTNVNKLNLRVRILDALDKSNLTPDKAYSMSKFLIIPPKFRPILPLPSGDLQVSDINKHYRDVGLRSKTLKTAIDEDLLDEDDKIKYERSLYDAVSAAQGFIDPATYGKQKYKGALKDLGDTKYGLVFGTAWAKRQDLTGRSTITPDPSLGLDEVALPKDIAKDLFTPFVMRKLVQSGIPAVKAKKMVNDWDPLAEKTLLDVMREKHVILNRAPSLHKHSVQAFRPTLTAGKNISTNPLINPGYNLDYDGDSLSA